MNNEIPTKQALLRCPVCNTPMAARTGLAFDVLKDQQGKRMITRVESLPAGPVTQSKIYCPRYPECKGAHIFVSVQEGIGLTEDVDTKIDRKKKRH